ncbi:hypothetical protein G4X40_12390 [Rhodococcus sp. D2-41]|nr:hypothetical protein [Rhodococcus sp. D2-41]MDG3010949.1 hypothetical protein [Rhodococcus sp. D2-41]
MSIVQSLSSHTGPATMPRRSVLRIAGAGLGLGLAGLTVAACSSDDSGQSVDPLIALSRSARQDAATATAMVAKFPDRATALTQIGTERTAHADAFDTEIARAAGATTASATATAVAPEPTTTLDQLRSTLRQSQREAAGVARTLSGYRAGLTGSVGAACAAEVAVLLP